MSIELGAAEGDCKRVSSVNLGSEVVKARLEHTSDHSILGEVLVEALWCFPFKVEVQRLNRQDGEEEEQQLSYHPSLRHDHLLHRFGHQSDGQSQWLL